MPAPETKYRPYFTLSQLKHIEQCMLAVKQQTQVDQETLRYIHKYISDIEHKYIQPSHTTMPRKTLLEKLEIGGTSSGSGINTPTPEEIAEFEAQFFPERYSQ